MKYLLIGCLLVLGLFIGSPFYASHRFIAAANGTDKQLFQQRLALPALRNSLKAQFVAQAKQELGGEQAVADNRLLQIGFSGVAALVETSLDHYLTPHGFRVLLHNPIFQQNLKDVMLSGPVAPLSWQQIKTSHFVGITHFELISNTGVQLEFQLSQAGWRLFAMRLPKA